MWLIAMPNKYSKLICFHSTKVWMLRFHCCLDLKGCYLLLKKKMTVTKLLSRLSVEYTKRQSLNCRSETQKTLKVVQLCRRLSQLTKMLKLRQHLKTVLNTQLLKEVMTVLSIKGDFLLSSLKAAPLNHQKLQKVLNDNQFSPSLKLTC